MSSCTLARESFVSSRERLTPAGRRFTPKVVPWAFLFYIVAIIIENLENLWAYLILKRPTFEVSCKRRSRDPESQWPSERNGSVHIKKQP